MEIRFTFIAHDGMSIRIGFRSLADVDEFLQHQSNNPSWWSIWNIRFASTDLEPTRVILETESAVNLNFS